MKIDIQTDPLIIFVDGLAVYVLPKNNKVNLADLFALYIGIKEYDGIVADILKWYYGKLVKASWCCTSVSYFANKLNILDKIGGKAENVNVMRSNCLKASLNGCGTYYDKLHIPDKISKGSILFYLWNGSTMTNTSNKHVSICYEDTTGNIIKSIGGNQDDSICIKNYSRDNLYAVYVIS